MEKILGSVNWTLICNSFDPFQLRNIEEPPVPSAVVDAVADAAAALPKKRRQKDESAVRINLSRNKHMDLSTD